MTDLTSHTSPEPTAERRWTVRRFAERCGVTVRTLHHYDRLGLLKPSATSEAGYRLYTERDVERVQQIVTLKYIGFSLREIDQLLREEVEDDLSALLARQRTALEERRAQIDRAIRAIDGAERVARVMRERYEMLPSLFTILETIAMNQNNDWMKRYYTEEQMADIASRGTPEQVAEGTAAWSALIAEVEGAAARGADPSSPEVQALLVRWDGLINAFTGGDTGIRESLNTLWKDQANWPTEFKRPYSDAADLLIRTAREARRS